MKETLKKSKGITLIALIITIVILIILTVLVIDLVVDGEIFDNSRETVDETNNRNKELQNTIDRLGEKLDEEKQPKITFAYSPSLDTWTNGDVVVTAAIKEPEEYDLQISRDGTTWESVNTLTYELNGKVYARAVKDGTQVGKTKVGEVTNIDKTPPTVGTIKGYEDMELQNELEFEVDTPGTIIYVSDDFANASTQGIYIEFINGSDNGSGMHKTTYKITSVGSSINDEWEKFYAEYVFDDSNTSLPIIKLDMMGVGDIVSSRLIGEEWTQYNVEVISEDRVGNVSEASFRVNLNVYLLV